MESRNLSIMMTDIKGFTNKTSGYSRDQIEELLRSHEQLLTPLFTKHNGTVIKTIGDAFLVTFESATNAVEAGMDIQRTLSANNTRVSEKDKLLVRVAVNSGEVNLRDGDIFGEPVNITARVESISLAEHVTFTETVRLQLNKESIPYTELGEFSLKGIPKPVTLYRVKHDWAVDVSFEEGTSGAASSASGDDNRDNKSRAADTGSSSYLMAALVILALIIGGLYLNLKASPLATVEKMIIAKEWNRALAELEKLLLKAPSNQKALSMKKACQLSLLDIYIKDEKIFEAIQIGNKLIKSSSGKELTTCKSKVLKAMSEIVERATTTGEVDYASKCLEKLDETMASNLTVLEYHIRLDMEKLENIYKTSLAKLPEGPSILLKSLREETFEKVIATVRKKLAVNSKEADDGTFKAMSKFKPLLDYYDGFRLIMRANTFTATALMESRSEVIRKASAAINDLASAYEKDESLREREETGQAFIALLKFYNVDYSGMRDDSAIRLRRTISTFLIDWMAPLLVTESLKGATVVDGAKASEAAYRLRHNTELILKAAGKLKMLDKKAMLRHDFKWFKKHERNDSALRTRLELCEKEVFAEKDTALTTEFEAVIQDLKDRLKIKWGEK